MKLSLKGLSGHFRQGIILEQHISLFDQMKKPIPGYTGIINNNTNPSEVAHLAA